MLVLTRKNGETVCISRRIEVKVLSINRNTVKLGFSAPPQVDIRRQEIPPMAKRRSRSISNSLPADAICHSLASF
jgi:carbon storage regulator